MRTGPCVVLFVLVVTDDEIAEAVGCSRGPFAIVDFHVHAGEGDRFFRLRHAFQRLFQRRDLAFRRRNLAFEFFEAFFHGGIAHAAGVEGAVEVVC